MKRIYKSIISLCLAVIIVFPSVIMTRAASFTNYSQVISYMNSAYGTGKKITKNGVACYAYSGKTLAQKYGIGRKDIVNYLQKYKDWFLRTDNGGSPTTVPRPGEGGAMNCAGFISYVLTAVKQGTKTAKSPWIWSNGVYFGSSEQFYSVVNAKITCYAFCTDSSGDCEDKLINSGLAEKGDIIIYLGNGNHTAIYWGKETFYGELTLNDTIWQSNVYMSDGSFVGCSGGNTLAEGQVYGHYAAILVKAGNEPIAPTGVRAVRTNTNNNKITWNSSANNTKYQIYAKKSTDTNYKLIGSTTNKYFVDNVSEVGYTYYYKIRGISSSKYATSSAVSFNNIPYTPLNLTKDNSVKKQIKLTWTGSATSYAYRIYRVNPDGTIKTFNTKKTSFSDTTVASGKNYKYYIKAYKRKSDGSVAWSLSSATVTCTAK